jgi:16S rRNA processing protein RimM
MVFIGRIVGTHGVKGALKIKPFTDFLERFSKSEILCIEIGDGLFERFQIESSYKHKTWLIVKFENLNSPNHVKQLIGKNIVITESDLNVLESGSYYIHDLIGLRILDEMENLRGEITDVFQLSSNDVYEVVDENGKKFLIPAVKDFIDEVNLDFGFMKLKNTEGMFD